MDNNYGSWSLPQLKEELKKRNAKLSGRKRELIERLESYDRNQNFGHDVVGEEFVMTCPHPQEYKDFNNDSEFVEIKMGAIENYLEIVDKQIDSDATNLYKEKFLRYLRLATSNNLFFIKSECRAQMKKTVTYKIDVSIDCDGAIVESQCECAAGMGPNAHCKHVCCVLYALYNFSSCGELITEETCTQRLQTFHRSKPFRGSPIKAKDLPLSALKASNVNFDPRPINFRNQPQYNDYFRNVWLNHRNVSNLPIVQLFAPANLYGVVNDHDYFELSPEDEWLRQNNIGTISDTDIQEIELKTLGQSKNQFWISERCKRLQSSMFGRICKATERTDFEKLADSLTTSSIINTPAIAHGKKFENVAIGKFENQMETSVTKCGLYVSKSKPFIAASPDGITSNNIVVEVKCPFVAKDKVICPKTVPFLAINEGKLSLMRTHNYFYQIQGQMFCTGCKKCYFVVYTFKDMKVLLIERDDDFIKEMVEKLEQFYKSYFKTAVLKKFLFRNYEKYSFQ